MTEQKAEKPTCKGTKLDGKSCTSAILRKDGYCAVHSPTIPYDPRKTGKQGAVKSAERRRARAEAARKQGREKLQEHFEGDEEVYAALKQAYFDALEAVTTCPSCKLAALPDHGIRLRAGDSLLAQIYGKPLTQTRTEATQEIIVVNRLEDALARVNTEQPPPKQGLRLIEAD